MLKYHDCRGKLVLFIIISLIFIMPFKLVSASDMPSVDKIKEAIELRNKALSMQNAGNYFEAMKVFAEAINLYPQYAQAYCDMGILYEAFGIKKDAEIIYLKALEIDPGCLNAYTNLALLYESRQDFPKAVCYWKKRAELGAPDDKWTQKAKERLLSLSQGVTQPPVSLPDIDERVKKEISDSTAMIKDEAKERKEINILKDNLSCREQELIRKKEDFELQKQEISILKDKRNEELSAKNQEIEQLKKWISLLQQEKSDKLSAKDEEIKKLKESILYAQEKIKEGIAVKQENDQLKQQIALLQQEKGEKLSAKDEEIKMLKENISYVQQKSKEGITKEQENDQLKQQVTLLQQENEKNLSAKDEEIKILKDNILYVKQKSKEEIENKEQEVARAAQQLTDLIGSLKNDVSSWKNNNSPQAAAIQD